MDKVERFERRLAETIAWCAAHGRAGNPEEGLRTVVLRPSEITSNTQTLLEAKLTQQEFFKQLVLDRRKKDQQWQQNVEQLAMKRATLLQTQHVTSPQLTLPLTGGRILVYDYHGSTSEGAASIPTQGFIDGHDRPAWDTGSFT